MGRARVVDRPHGVNKYKTEGCRCQECRSAVADLERARRYRGRESRVPILCGGCLEEIEHCYGAETDWMHTTTRREHCASGGLACPETVVQYDARMKRRHARNMANMRGRRRAS